MLSLVFSKVALNKRILNIALQITNVTYRHIITTRYNLSTFDTHVQYLLDYIKSGYPVQCSAARRDFGGRCRGAACAGLGLARRREGCEAPGRPRALSAVSLFFYNRFYLVKKRSLQIWHMLTSNNTIYTVVYLIYF